MVRRINLNANFRAEEKEGKKIITAYFSVFNETYEISPYMSEEIDSHAFDNAINSDIRALVNHDTTLVLGRTTAGTLKLSVDEHGLKGEIEINNDDQDALNLYARVERGDVNQGSFGFDILDEESKTLENGKTHYIVKSVKLYEVSIVTFPAYEGTVANARGAREKDAFENYKLRLKERIKNAKNTDA